MNDTATEFEESRRQTFDERIAQWIYNVIILPFLLLSFYTFSLFHDKIRRGIRGRRNWPHQLENALGASGKSAPTVLIHAASMGEYEQARPVIREIRRILPHVRIVASVFSPSAFEHIQNRNEVDALTYLPIDTRRQMRRFLRMLNPAALLIVRYELWPNFIWEAARRGTFIALIDASVQAGSLRAKWPVNRFYRALFRRVHQVLAISEEAARRLRRLVDDPAKVRVAGDTRFDQVVYRAREKTPAELLPQDILACGPFWVAGSTWPEDDAVVIPAFADVRQSYNLRLVLVPHEPSASHLQAAEALCRKHGLRSLRLSRYPHAKTDSWEVLIVDRIGILANLYAMGQVAFVGGSFGPGVHSVIEPAAHGLPVLFGPRMQNSPEAAEMIHEGCGFVIRSRSECVQKLRSWFEHPEILRRTSKHAQRFVEQRVGASPAIAQMVRDILSRS